MHLTDDQLNEYLDNESSARTQIEAHLAECVACAARLTALQNLFAEIESLPELALSRSIAAPFTRPVSLPAHLPRWLTLTAALQAVLALIAIPFGAPLISQLIAPLWQARPVPAWRDMVFQLPMSFMLWIQSIQSLEFTLPRITFTLPAELSTGVLSASLPGLFFLWIVGNWWLLHKRPKTLA